MNANARLQCNAVTLIQLPVELCELFDDRSAGVDRTHGVVLVGLRRAEIGEQAVAQQFGDVTAKRAHGRRRQILKRPQNFAQILRIKLFGKLRRTDQIDEHHGQLAAFRRCGDGLDVGVFAGGGRRLVAQRGDRTEDLAPRTECDADFFEVSVRDERQGGKINLVLGKGREILTQAEPFEPLADVSRHQALFRSQFPNNCSSFARAIQSDDVEALPAFGSRTRRGASSFLLAGCRPRG